jgi:protein gp37
MLSDNNWRQPLRWNRAAEKAGVRARVFCASMADVFEDHPDVVEPRARLWPLIEQTPWLDWQLLTKRPENVVGMVPWGSDWPTNVWLGTSVENQTWADARVPVLLDIPAKVRFLSCEPLLGAVNLDRWLPRPFERQQSGYWLYGTDPHGDDKRWVSGSAIGWVIVGGESGGKARPMDVAWVLSLVDQCRDNGVPVHVKQLGSVWAKDMSVGGELVSRSDPKGGNWDNWPTRVRVREFPGVAR